MNSVTAVLVVLVLAVVFALIAVIIVSLALRSRSSEPPRGSRTQDPGVDAPGPADPVGAVDAVDPVDPVDPVDAVAPVGEGGSLDPGLGAQADHERSSEDEPDDTTSARADQLSEQTTDDEEPAAEELVEPGPSGLEAEPSVVTDAGPLSGSAPRTTAEAFGSAQASGDAAASEAASRETSVLDDGDLDSTPLFRSIRDELFGSSIEEESDEALALAGAQAQEADRTWSDERRGWDEQAHAEPEELLEPDVGESAWSETVTEGVGQTGAVGAGSDDPAAKEEELLETSEEKQDLAAGTTTEGVAREHPPIRRFSELHEVADGGFGIGSARTIEDGAQPLGHPIKANVDTKTYQDLHSPWYDETEPDVWFLDAGFAERAGFHRAE